MLMPLYNCHKQVRALKIKEILDDPVTGSVKQLVFENENYPPRVMSSAWVEHRGARAGGYYVRYDDGYESFSPANTFEEGYSLAEKPLP